MGSLVGRALAGIRKAKSEAKVSQRTDVGLAVVAAPAGQLGLLEQAADDLRGAGRVERLSLVDGADDVEVREVELLPAG